VRLLLHDWFSDDVLDAMVRARKRAALTLPYSRFQALLARDRKTDSLAIHESALRVHSDLSEFDSLRTRPSARDVTKAMRAAQAELERIADGSLTAQEALDTFTMYAALMQSAWEAVDTTKSQVEKTSKTMGGSSAP
jgi:hypothetical protein